MTDDRRPLFFLSAGEPSGDAHAAELIAELKRRFPNARFVGYGGPKMETAGCEVQVFLTRLAVMWFGRVLWNLRTFLRYLKDAELFFRRERPDAVILVDFPGFNWLIAKRAKAVGVPVYYFMPPQIWSWGQWRVKKMKRLVDHILCCLPFEEKWFQERGCDAHRIGHPFFEEVRNKTLDVDFIDSFRNVGKVWIDRSSAIGRERFVPSGSVESEISENGFESNAASETLGSEPFDSKSPILTILPGSRNQEVATNLSDMLDAVEKVLKSVPRVRPAVAAFSESQAVSIRAELEKRGLLTTPVFVGRTPELMEVADCCLAVSGSVSMELLAHKKPSIIYYRVGRLGYFVQRFFRRVKYITLVNLLAADQLYKRSIFYDSRVRLIPTTLSEDEQEAAIFPEFLTDRNRSDEVARRLVVWLTDSESRRNEVERLERLLRLTDLEGSPIQNAGRYIEKTLNESRTIDEIST